jgi:hypothetical protein
MNQNQTKPARPRSFAASLAWYAWITLVAAAMLWARRHEPNAPPPTREAFEERHRLCYDIYAAADHSHAYDLLSAAFAGPELDRQYCAFAKAAEQLRAATADVTVYALQYEDFKVLESRGSHCRVYSKWSVVYILGHSQHSHVRNNVYEAEFELDREGDGWRIVSSRIVNENSVA